MITHVPFEHLNDRHTNMLARSMHAAPAEEQPDADCFIRAVMLGTMRLFEFPGGMVLCGKRDNRLVLYALVSEHLLADAIPLTADMKRLAADWECDTIETTIFDRRLASVIEKLGGRIESVTLVMPVE